MLSDVKKFYDAILDSNLNITALIIILILTGLALRGTFKENSVFNKFARQSPSILATVGIFFSFLGIALALMDFDPKNIENSIPHLLDGLKVKFIASLMGIFASIVVRIAQTFKLKHDIVENIDNEQVMIDLLKDIKQSLSENKPNSSEQLLKKLKETIALLPPEFKTQSRLLGDIKSSLAGEGDASVTTQLLKVRTTVSDGLNELDKHNKEYLDKFDSNNQKYLSAIGNSIVKKFDGQNEILDKNFTNLIVKFDEFAKVLAENNSKAFIEALEKAMRDFNNNITEQFGSNFQKLNEAVGRLVDWQDKYKNDVERLTSNFEIVLNGIEKIKADFSDIENRSQSFTNTSENLHGILENLDRQLKDLTKHLQAFDELADNAKNSFPRIEDNLTKLTTGFKNSTEQSLAKINETVEDVGSNLKETSRRLKETTGQIQIATEEQKSTLETTSQEFKTVAKNLAKETQKSIDDYRDSLQETTSEQLRVIDGSIKKSNGLINETVENAKTTFETSINETGEALKAATNDVRNQLTSATGSMQSMIANQEKTLTDTSNKFATVVDKTLVDLSNETQSSIKTYQESLQTAVTGQLTAIDKAIKSNNDVVNQSIKEAGSKFEQAIKSTGEKLTATTGSMQSIIARQENSLTETSNKFNAVVTTSLANLEKGTQDSYVKYQQVLERIIKEQAELMSDTVKKTGLEFEKSITDTSAKFNTMANTIKQSVESQEKTLTGVSENFKSTVDRTLQDLSEKSKSHIHQYEQSLQQSVQNQLTAINSAISGSSKEFNRLLTQNMNESTDVLKQQMKHLDEDLQKELGKAIETMGKHLAALSNQFVKDYSPLTEKLREVVRLADNLRGRN